MGVRRGVGGWEVGGMRYEVRKGQNGPSPLNEKQLCCQLGSL